MSVRKKIKKLQAHLDERLDKVDKQLESILEQFTGKKVALVSGSAWSAYMGDFPGNTLPIPPEPQINSGMTGKKQPDNTQLGRGYSQPGSVIERWVLDHPSSIRDVSSYILYKISDDTSSSYLVASNDLGTGYIANNVTTARAASNEFDYLQIPSSGPGTPPAGTITRYYSLTQITFTGNGSTSADKGRLYREIHTDENGNEVWSDHYVLYPGYEGPKLAQNGDPQIDVQLDRLTSGIPSTVDAFLAQQRQRQTDLPGNTYKYAHVFLTWTALPTS